MIKTDVGSLLASAINTMETPTAIKTTTNEHENAEDFLLNYCSSSRLRPSSCIELFNAIRTFPTLSVCILEGCFCIRIFVLVLRFFVL